MVKIAFVYPPFLSSENQPNIRAVAENYGVFPPLTLAQTAAVAKQSGCGTILIDANALSLSKEEVLKKIRDFQPDILGFTVTTYLFYQTLEWIEFLKKETQIPVLVGGVHMGLYPEETLTHSSIDFGLMGEAEVVLPDFLNRFDDKKKLEKCPGIVFRNRKGKIIINREFGILKSLDDAPFPSRELLPNEKYYSFISKRRNFTGLITSRGCPYRCIFCEQKSVHFRKRSPADIMREIHECYHSHGIRETDFFDSAFTIDKKRVIELCRLLQREKLDLIWSARSRVDNVDWEMLSEMKKAGCTRIYYGIESGDENILKTLKKGTSIDRIRQTVSLTKKAGIDTFGYFMIGNPAETEGTIRKTIDLAKSLELDYSQFSKLSTLPGTELYEMWKGEFKTDYWREFILDEKNKRIMKRYKCDLSEGRIEHYVKKAYREFYYRPNYLLKRLFKLGSLHEFRRSIKAAADMFFE